jgi:F0F1-type ATP synthase delta subunit
VTQEVKPLTFPPALVGRSDLSRLLRELEALDNELESQKARSHGKTDGYHIPNMSRALNDFLEINKIDIANDHVRMDIRSQMRKLKDHAPVVHMTFATETDPESMQKIVDWIRKELHPQALISVGLQPSLVGGVYIRTPNHVHDLSIRAHMRDSREVIVKALDALAKGVQTA